MRGLQKLTKTYFNQFRTTPLKLKAFDPQAKKIGTEFVKYLVKSFNGISNVDISLRGSTLFEIIGKGDIDIAVYTDKKSFHRAVEMLTKLYGDAKASGKTFAAFYTTVENYQVEISVIFGHEAKVDKTLTDYLVNHKEILQRYVDLKLKFCFSKREYLIERDKFFRKIIKSI